MNGTLYVLATTAAAPTDPWAPLLGGLLTLLTGGVIGFVLGILRDASKAKADREARHQEQVLEAVTGLLGASAQIQKAAAAMTRRSFTMVRVQKEYADTSLDPENKRDTATTAFLDAGEKFSEATEIAESHALRISILSPNMETLAETVVVAATNTGATEGEEGQDLTRTFRREYEASIREFKAAARAYLKVPIRSKTARRRAH